MGLGPAGVALQVTEGRQVDALQIAANGESQFKRELSLPTEGYLVQVDLKVDITAVGDHASLDRGAVRDEPHEPGSGVSQIHICYLPGYGPCFGHETRYVWYGIVYARVQRRLPTPMQGVSRPHQASHQAENGSKDA